MICRPLYERHAKPTANSTLRRLVIVIHPEPPVMLRSLPPPVVRQGRATGGRYDGPSETTAHRLTSYQRRAPCGPLENGPVSGSCCLDPNKTRRFPRPSDRAPHPLVSTSSSTAPWQGLMLALARQHATPRLSPEALFYLS